MALPILAHWAGRSIFDIEPAALARRGIRLLLADLDNTLAPYGEPEPTQAVRDWAAALGEQGITLFVLSNNRHPERPRDILGGRNAGVFTLLVEPIRLAGNPGRYLRYGAEWPFRMWSKRRTKPL